MLTALFTKQSLKGKPEQVEDEMLEPGWAQIDRHRSLRCIGTG